MRGRVVKYERDNIDTDVIVPGTYLKYHDPAILAEHAMEGLDPDFRGKGGTFVLAGKNFGCGSSREHAPIALAGCGIRAVLAPSFARIFYRNAVDGAFLLPVEIGEEAYRAISDGDELEVDTDRSRIYDVTTGEEYPTKPFPDIIAGIIAAGGLFRYDPGV